MFKAPVLIVPLTAMAPLQSPLAVQEDGEFVAFQVRVALLPVVTEIGAADKLTVGAIGGTTFTEILFAKPVPPALSQDSE